jgi:predicted transcriptional regulator
MMVKEASYIHGASSVMSPGLAEALSTRIVEGIPVELVVNEEAAEKLRQEPYLTPIKQLLSFPNFKILISKVPFKVGLTVTDKRISLGLFKKDGKMYDVGSDLVSIDPDAIAWGEKLFNYFKEHSAELMI